MYHKTDLKLMKFIGHTGVGDLEGNIKDGRNISTSSSSTLAMRYRCGGKKIVFQTNRSHIYFQFFF